MIAAFAVIVGLYALFTSVLLFRSYSKDVMNPLILLKALVVVTVFVPIANSRADVSFEAQFIIATAGVFHIVILDYLFIRSTKFIPQHIKKHSGNKKITRMWFIVWALGWISRLISLATGSVHGTLLATQLEVSSFSNILGMANNISTLGLIGFLTFVPSNKSRSLLVLMVVFEMSWGLASGSKIGIIYAVIPIIYVAQRRGFITLSLWKFGTGAIIFLVCSNFIFVSITAYRVSVQTAALKEGQITLQILTESAVDALTSKNTRQIAHQIVNSESNVSNRTDYVTFFGRIYDRPDLWTSPERPGTLLTAFVWWVPRFIWNEKPINSVGSWFGEKVYGWSGNSRSQAAITIWGDGLINAGVFGVYLFPAILFLIVYFFIKICNRMGLWGVLLISSLYTKFGLSLEVTLGLTLIAIQVQFVMLKIFKHLGSSYVSSISDTKTGSTLRRNILN